MYLLLRADQRLKQNHEDGLLAAHQQELYLSVKDLGLIKSQKPIRPSITQCQNNWVLFFVMVIYLEKTMERSDSGNERNIFGTILCNLNIGLMKSGRVQWRKAEETRKISILYWSIRTRNSLSPSSSRSFRTQSRWSCITGQCINSERFLRVHLSHRMCNQFTLHHKFEIDSGRTKFEQKTDGILLRLWILWTKNTEIQILLTWKHHVLHGTSRKSGRSIKTRCVGLRSNLLKRKDLSSVKQDRTQSSFTTHAQLIVSRRLSWWKLEKS